jgi:hypothetical protein
VAHPSSSNTGFQLPVFLILDFLLVIIFTRYDIPTPVVKEKENNEKKSPVRMYVLCMFCKFGTKITFKDGEI